MTAHLLSAITITAATLIALGSPPASAQNADVSLFERLGIAPPSRAQSQILTQRVLPADQRALARDLPAQRPLIVSAPVQPAVVLAAPPSMTEERPAPVQLAQVSAPMTQNDNPSGQIAMTPKDPWTTLLQRYMQQEGDLTSFDYAALSDSDADMAALQRYIDDLAAMTPSKMERNEALAYWGNLYNALTVQVVAKNWPVKSIKQIKSGVFTPGPWKLKLVKVEGQSMSLDDIEHGTMRKNFDEPRIHYIVNCASIGCPNLKMTAWDAQTLERDMTAGAKAFINSPRGVQVIGGKLTVSSIYKWFQVDFGGDNAGVIAHLRQYADAELKAQLDGVSTISKDDYNWDVNAK